MNKQIRNTAFAVFSMMAVLFASTAMADDNVAQMQNDCQTAMANLERADSTLAPYFTNSAGYAIFPEVGKAGLIIGGARGKGLVFEKGNSSPIAKTTMTQASIGAQVGGQTFDEVIFFDSPTSLNTFKQGGFQMSADVSAVLASEGSASSAKFSQGVLVFTLPRSGLMAQASIGGQNFSYDPLPK